MIIATAGHVDHGKTTLVRRLTGVDTDRLPEERRRGMTIDLGFAYIDAFGTRVGFVDVPGHERFVGNMLVGASGIDVALVVVAADDGVMPQTREHVAILDLLGVDRAVVALTKCDRASPERIAAVADDVRALLAGTALDGAAIVPTCAPSGAGIDALLNELDALARAVREAPRGDRAAPDARAFRLAIDRAFTLAGTGTVVTGYVHAGACARGSELRLLPADLQVRVRGVHANNIDTAQASVGERAAVALAGVERDACSRGGWLVDAEAIVPTRHLVARLHPRTQLPAHRDWLRVHLHVGGNDVVARAHTWRADAAPGGNALLELRFEAPLPLCHGDRFVLRDESARETLGGGTVIDPHPPARGLRGKAYRARLAVLAAATPERALEAAAAADTVLDIESIARAWGMPRARIDAHASALGLVRLAGRARTFVLSSARAAELDALLLQAVGTWHKANPHVRGIRLDQLRAVLRARMPSELLVPAIDALLARGALARSAGYLQLPGHAPRISHDDADLWHRIEPLLTATPRPPVVHELAKRLHADIEPLRVALRRLAFAGLVIPVAENRYFPTAQVDALMDVARRLDDDAAGEGFSAAQFRDATPLGRNLAIDVLQHFDNVGFTYRRGDVRRISRLAPRGQPAEGQRPGAAT